MFRVRMKSLNDQIRMTGGKWKGEQAVSNSELEI